MMYLIPLSLSSKVKQTVMTSVYGVTAVGARSQISNRLTERGWTNEAEIFQVLKRTKWD